MSVKGKLSIEHDMEIQVRPTQRDEPEFFASLKRFCQSNPDIEKAYLLDTRKPGRPEQYLLLAVRTSGSMDDLAGEFQALLSRYPDLAKEAFLFGAERFEQQLLGPYL